MALSSVVKTKRDGILAFADNGGFAGSNLLTLSKEPGDMTWTEAGPERADFLDRGRLVGDVRHGDDRAVTGSFSHYLRDASDNSEAVPLDLYGWDPDGTVTYIDVNWVPTLGANAEVATCDMRYTVEGSDHGDGADHSWTLTDVSFEHTVTEGTPSTVAVSYRSHSDTRWARA